jgi:two-component system sensor histidine kinase KdpD
MARGRLRIYLGAAPGVGKTVAMLSEGARRKARGTDVVVGVVETHDRAHTAAMLEGFEIVPRRTVPHRGATITEMDLPAVLSRHPQVVLVDELAHTNAPGSENQKRWQDIEALLAAGIDVISTVNIQHLESLNNAVEDITGIVQQERVPDAVVRSADQIELVDMSPEALRRRMAHGNVYKADKVDAALAHYFRVGNLAALRELALLWLADRVDEGLDSYRHAHDIDATWPTRERIVVAVSGGPESEALVRRGARIAARGAGGELDVLYVARADGLAGAPVEALAKVRRMVEELGGTFHTISGEDRARAILQFARAENASTILIGASRRPWWRALVRPGVAAPVIEGSGDIDVHVVTHQAAGTGHGDVARAPLARRRVIEGYLWGLVGGAVLTAALWLIDVRLGAPLGLPLIVQIYLVHTIIASLIGGMGPAIITAVVSSLTVNWFFTPPLGNLTIAEPENALALALFIVVAAAVSLVVHRSSRRAESALAAQQESAALAELTHTLLGSTEQLALLLSRAVDMFGVSGAAVVRRRTKDEPNSIIAATEAFDLGGGAVTKEAADDEHDLILTGGMVPAERKRLLAAYAAHAGAILARRALQDQARSAEHLTRDNRARTALLSAVSHDLRTPLAGIKAAIGSLRSHEVEFSAQDRAELEEAIEDSADRLESLIGNLLDLSRLQVGALVAHPRLTDLGEVVPAAIIGSDAAGRVTWALGDGARYAEADPGLLDRVLSNLVENAMRHHDDPAKIRVTTSRIREEVQLRVIDSGPGIPEAMREPAFQPFQRHTDSGGNGVGLGLAVARGLTEAMGGTLTAEETPGGGLTMVVALPAGVSS